MEIRGPDNPSRPDLDRASDTRKADRAKPPLAAGKQAGSHSEGDSLEVSTSRLIEESVSKVLEQLERRTAEQTSRREELLSLADDPASIRKAAQEFLAATTHTDRV